MQEQFSLIDDDTKTESTSGDNERDFQIIRVLLPISIDEPFSYKFYNDDDYKDDITIGSYVKVPFRNIEHIGLVWQIPKVSDYSDVEEAGGKRLKAVIRKLPLNPMRSELLSLIKWIANYYVANIGLVLKLAMAEKSVFEPMQIEYGYRWNGNNPKRMTDKRNHLLEIAKNEVWSKSKLSKEAKTSNAVINSLIKEGIFEKTAIKQLPLMLPNIHHGRLKLSDEQEAAYEKWRQNNKHKKFNVHLLDGITGSGKTEVYFEAMTSILQRGGQVLILLPEISLTPNFQKHFKRRFGILPAQWHSQLNSANRKRIYHSVAKQEIKVVVGARSALYLPFQNLQLIIVDEEHDSSYKQEDGVPYNARDMSVVYAKIWDIPIILSSATASVETEMNIQKKRYQHLKLKKRIEGAELPSFKLVDMKLEKPKYNHFISDTLKENIDDRLSKGEQAMIFLNRRGYAPLTICKSCGYKLECPNCSALLIEHRNKNRLMCHHCGYFIKKYIFCPSCEAEGSLAQIGPGVERVYDELKEKFSKANIVMLSSDMLTTLTKIKQVFDDIINNETNIIIGTQLIAKGHHFPNLSLVGVIDADFSNSLIDLRAAERSFQLLQQVSGRAGRENKKGMVILQTHEPDSPIINALINNDKTSFYNSEIELRKEADLPPFSRIASIIISGTSDQITEAYAKELVKTSPISKNIEIFGPAPPQIYMLQNRFRQRILIKASLKTNLSNYLKDWKYQFPRSSKVRVKIDVDPHNFM